MYVALFSTEDPHKPPGKLEAATWSPLDSFRLLTCLSNLFTRRKPPSSYGCQPRAQSNASSVAAADSSGQQSLSKFDSHPYDGPINFRALFWVDRGPVIWSMQTTIAVICFVEALLMQYLTYKVSVVVGFFCPIYLDPTHSC